jgi:hypothetical protein
VNGRIGVPVRIGIGPTKTLAKCANDIVKKNPIFGGVLDVMDDALATWLLPMVPVGDIWGLGVRQMPNYKSSAFIPPLICGICQQSKRGLSVQSFWNGRSSSFKVKPVWHLMT